MRVVLADDQVWLRSALRLLLEHEPNLEVVGEVDNAGELPQATATLQPDLIVLDWDLAELKTPGARQQLMTTLRTLQPQLYIIALTGNHDWERFCSTTGADAFVSKAEPPNCLLAAIHQAQAIYRPKVVA
jgi:DNA-binding NarL/FixJ family response regulator